MLVIEDYPKCKCNASLRQWHKISRNCPVVWAILSYLWRQFYLFEAKTISENDRWAPLSERKAREKRQSKNKPHLLK